MVNGIADLKENDQKKSSARVKELQDLGHLDLFLIFNIREPKTHEMDAAPQNCNQSPL
jgi:hypothetical protein